MLHHPPGCGGCRSKNSDHRLEEASGDRAGRWQMSGWHLRGCLQNVLQSSIVSLRADTYSQTHTHKCTSSTVLPLLIILSPSSRKCAVPCYDRWLAFRDEAAPTVCLSPLRMAAEWQLGPVHVFESIWQEKLGSFGLTHLLFRERKNWEFLAVTCLRYEYPLVNHIHSGHLSLEYYILLLEFMSSKLDYAAKDISAMLVCKCVFRMFTIRWNLFGEGIERVAGDGDLTCV